MALMQAVQAFGFNRDAGAIHQHKINAGDIGTVQINRVALADQLAHQLVKIRAGKTAIAQNIKGEYRLIRLPRHNSTKRVDLMP